MPQRSKADGELESAAATRTPTPLQQDRRDHAADITIRLCRGEPSGTSPAFTWKSESVLVYMIEDLVLASRGRVADESPNCMTAHFTMSSDALVAAQRIQAASLEFVACRPGDYLSAAILIHPSITVPAGFSADRLQAELRLAQPGQILLSGEISRRLQEHPGIQLRAIPGLTTGGQEQEGLSELEWTPPDRSDSRSAPSNEAQPVEEGPPFGATMIVNAPFGTRGRANQLETESRATEASSPDPGFREMADTAGDTSQEQLADFEERPFLTRQRVIVSLATVVVLGLLVAVFYPHGTKPPIKDEPSQSQTSQDQGDSAQGTNGTASTQSTGGNPDHGQTDQPVVPKHPKPKKKTSQEESAEEKENGQQSVGGVTRADIPILLDRADQDRGNGRYDDAKREYDIVLGLDPNNARAKQGLNRLKQALGEQ